MHNDEEIKTLEKNKVSDSSAIENNSVITTTMSILCLPIKESSPIILVF